MKLSEDLRDIDELVSEGGDGASENSDVDESDDGLLKYEREIYPHGIQPDSDVPPLPNLPSFNPIQRANPYLLPPSYSHNNCPFQTQCKQGSGSPEILDDELN